MATSYERGREEPFELRRQRPKIDDACILRDVRAVLAGILGVEARNLVVMVQNGEVSLVGRVSERWMKLELEHASLQVDGVRDVLSRVTAPKP